MQKFCCHTDSTGGFAGIVWFGYGQLLRQQSQPSVEMRSKQVVNCNGLLHYPREGVRSARCRGFSLLDVVVTLGLVALLSSLLMTGLSRGRAAANSAQCLSNLHNISVAFSQYAIVNEMRYPCPSAVGKSWESLLHPYAPQSMLFACPADNEIFSSVGSSYDWRDTTNPITTLAGRSMMKVVRGDAVLAFETLPGWHNRHSMNAVLVDGSALVMGDDACLTDLSVSAFSLGASNP